MYRHSHRHIRTAMQNSSQKVILFCMVFEGAEHPVLWFSFYFTSCFHHGFFKTILASFSSPSQKKRFCNLSFTQPPEGSMALMSQQKFHWVKDQTFCSPNSFTFAWFQASVSSLLQLDTQCFLLVLFFPASFTEGSNSHFTWQSCKIYFSCSPNYYSCSHPFPPLPHTENETTGEFKKNVYYILYNYDFSLQWERGEETRHKTLCCFSSENCYPETVMHMNYRSGRASKILHMSSSK